jgi:hypothetical protein
MRQLKQQESSYTLAAKTLLRKHNLALAIHLTDMGVKNSDWCDGLLRNKYRVIIRDYETRKCVMSYTFWGSHDNYNRGIKPTAYDVLSCLTTSEPEADYQDFAREYGYSLMTYEDRAYAKRLHHAVNKEYDNTSRVFGDAIDNGDWDAMCNGEEIETCDAVGY